MTFETGASTHGANNLVLSVMNDGSVYADRKHIVFSAMQSANHRGMTMRDIVDAEAKRQRKVGCKFTAKDISEAARIIFEKTLDRCIEIIRDTWTGENIQARGLKWWDKVNGNTYFSARMQIPCDVERIVDIPYQYGYGDQWQWEVIATLRKMGFTMPEHVPFYQLPITFDGAVYTKKRDMFEGLAIFKG